MTMVMITALAVTRERERGTMESLLATPALPLEVMTGKIIPYILVGYVQVTLILLAAKVLFRVPMVGSFAPAPLPFGAMLYRRHTRRRHHHLDAGYEPTASPADVVLFLSALPVALRIHVSVPGNAESAQAIGQVLPLTHFLRVLRGILLKGNEFPDVWPEIWPILVFGFLLMAVGAVRYRRTLD